MLVGNPASNDLDCKTLAMYERTANLYDLAYADKDYAGEAAWVRDTIRARSPQAKSLLDVACGTGKHLERLQAEFACEGLDLTPEFVEIAGERTGLTVHCASMDAFDLDRRFDAVVCLFSSIGYSGDLNGAVGSMARHLTPDGVLIVEPWLTHDQWVPGHVQVVDHEAGGTRLIRMTRSWIDGDASFLEMHHLVASDSGIEHLVETHRLTLFSLSDYESAFLASNLTFEFDGHGPMGRGALIGQPAKPSR
jgi:SAM-dependent methyltransferase